MDKMITRNGRIYAIGHMAPAAFADALTTRTLAALAAEAQTQHAGDLARAARDRAAVAAVQAEQERALAARRQQIQDTETQRAARMAYLKRLMHGAAPYSPPRRP